MLAIPGISVRFSCTVGQKNKFSIHIKLIESKVRQKGFNFLTYVTELMTSIYIYSTYMGIGTDERVMRI